MTEALDVLNFWTVETYFVLIFNEQKLVLGLQHVKVKVQMEKFRNSMILPELLDDL